MTDYTCGGTVMGNDDWGFSWVALFNAVFYVFRKNDYLHNWYFGYGQCINHVTIGWLEDGHCSPPPPATTHNM